MLEKLEAKKKSVHVVEQLLDAINRGVYKVGDKLPSEEMLAEQTGVSRPSVREALVAKEMGIPEEEELVRLQRIRLIDGEPLALQTSFVRHCLCPGLVEKGLLEGSLYKTMEEGYGLRLGRARQTFEAKPADEYEAKLLEVATAQPVLVLERLTYLHDGLPIEYVRSTYRGDRYRFTVELCR